MRCSLLWPNAVGGTCCVIFDQDGHLRQSSVRYAYAAMDTMSHDALCNDMFDVEIWLEPWSTSNACDMWILNEEWNRKYYPLSFWKGIKCSAEKTMHHEIKLFFLLLNWENIHLLWTIGMILLLMANNEQSIHSLFTSYINIDDTWVIQFIYQLNNPLVWRQMI